MGFGNCTGWKSNPDPAGWLCPRSFAPAIDRFVRGSWGCPNGLVLRCIRPREKSYASAGARWHRIALCFVVHEMDEWNRHLSSSRPHRSSSRSRVSSSVTSPCSSLADGSPLDQALNVVRATSSSTLQQKPLQSTRSPRVAACCSLHRVFAVIFGLYVSWLLVLGLAMQQTADAQPSTGGFISNRLAKLWSLVANTASTSRSLEEQPSMLRGADQIHHNVNARALEGVRMNNSDSTATKVSSSSSAMSTGEVIANTEDPRSLSTRLLDADEISMSSGEEDSDSDQIEVNQVSKQALESPKASTNLILPSSDDTERTLSVTPATLPLVDEEDPNQYECVAWRQTSGCSPDGPIESMSKGQCDKRIARGVSGFCELRHRLTNQTKRVMQIHCDSLRENVVFNCGDIFSELLTFQQQATHYVHDAKFSVDANQNALQTENPTDRSVDFHRAIVMVVYEKLLPSVYASILNLRAMNCKLPVELWYRRDELDPNHPVLHQLVTKHGVWLREMTDPRATGFYSKLHAIFYSAFDQVLFLDADNFAVRDPSFLFELPQFTSTGAIFWPDFWHPESTIFNVQAHSLVWELFGLPFVDEFEQESGQLLIHRRRHMKALNLVMYYGFHQPRLQEQLRLLWGDKDLFRFAWRKTDSLFFFVPFAPGSAGLKANYDEWFCGATIVQHDMDNQVLFLHRNGAKLSADKLHKVWTHLQQFRLPPCEFKKFRVYGMGAGMYHDRVGACFGKDRGYGTVFTVKPITDFPFAGLEDQLLQYARDAKQLSL